MTDVRGRWSEVGERIEALALKLKLHFEQTGRSGEAAEPLQKLRDSVNDAFEAAGNAVRDDAVKADVKQTARLFLDALAASLSKAADSLRDEPTTEQTAEPPSPSAPHAVEAGAATRDTTPDATEAGPAESTPDDRG